VSCYVHIMCIICIIGIICAVVCWLHLGVLMHIINTRFAVLYLEQVLSCIQLGSPPFLSRSCTSHGGIGGWQCPTHVNHPLCAFSLMMFAFRKSIELTAAGGVPAPGGGQLLSFSPTWRTLFSLNALQPLTKIHLCHRILGESPFL
jgi:hypothetical protein